jgi:clan AA aspartic protease (TIGR02281 family)
MAHILALLFALLVLVPSTSSPAAEYFRWVDDKGNVHFTDNLHNIPEKSRADIDRYLAPENKTPPPAPKTKASIPFEKQGSVVIVDATFNRRTTAKLVVDTGASYTMISSATAKELNIDAAQNQRTAPFQTANGTIQAPLINLDSITVGGIEIKNLTAAVHDIHTDAKVAGLLGLDFLSNFRMDIDTEKGMLYLEKK